MPDTAARPKLDLMFLLSWAAHALATEQTAGLSGLGITPRAYCALYKALPGTLTQRQLADICGLDKSTMMLTIDELERKGLVERTLSATDRRVRIITVTASGRAVLAEAEGIVARIQDDVLAALPAEQSEALMQGLANLVEGRLSAFVECERPRRGRGHAEIN